MTDRGGQNSNQPYFNCGKIQTYVQSDKQFMCRILSFCGYNGPRLFEYFATKPKNFQDIINQILFQMKIFQSSYNNFKKHNPKKQYEYPNN